MMRTRSSLPLAIAATLLACGTSSESNDVAPGPSQAPPAPSSSTAPPPPPGPPTDQPPPPPPPPPPPAPTAHDGVQNGVETDVDCGGIGNPKCDAGKHCLGHGDCATDACSYEEKCIVGRSCTRHYGGDTCGLGGDGGQGPQQWESCCATAPVAGVQLGKYQVTAGRMRAFIERVGGNVRKFVRDARAAKAIPAGVVMRPEWDPFLPSAMDGCERPGGKCDPDEVLDTPAGGQGDPYPIWSSAYRHLGGEAFEGQGLFYHGCRVDAPGTHSYWMDAATQSSYFGDLPAEHSQDVYDTKPLNCVSYLMAQAFCIWDGGRLETYAEWLAAWGPNTMPWGAGPEPWGPTSKSYYGGRFPFATDATVAQPPGPVPDGKTIEQANWYWSYEYPFGIDYDAIVFMSAPGRLKGRGPFGHADIVGSAFEHTSEIVADTLDPRTSTNKWTNNGSWQGHQFGKTINYDGTFSLTNKYIALGLRCAY